MSRSHDRRAGPKFLCPDVDMFSSTAGQLVIVTGMYTYTITKDIKRTQSD
jgi:hypothetical protein